MSYLHKEVSGGVQREAARPQPAGPLHADAQPQGLSPVWPVHRPSRVWPELPFDICALLLVLDGHGEGVVQYVSGHDFDSQGAITSYHLEKMHTNN